MFKKLVKNIGPGPLVAAAFIGPGTVTVCTLAGVKFGYSLLWAMGLSILATIVLQEMAARVGVVTQKGLAEIIRQEINTPVFKVITVILVLSAIVIGNAAYEAGNISGGVLGLETLIGDFSLEIGTTQIKLLPLVIGILAFTLLYLGNYKMLERALIGMVILMSMAFLITAVMTKPSFNNLLTGLFKFQSPEGSLLTIIGLLGTTVVPYNLFLHAALVKEKWHKSSDLALARKDTLIAIVLGGLVSMCIIVSAAAIQGNEITSAADLAKAVEPLFGSFAKYFIAIGLFAAGITSTITAPLAAAYVATGCLNWSSNMKSFKFRLVWLIVLSLGVIFASLGFKSIEVIQFAQIANGLLLPVIAGLLIWIVNKQAILGDYKNNWKQNLMALIIFAVVTFLGLRTVLKVLLI